jgi:hypothetical protein
MTRWCRARYGATHEFQSIFLVNAGAYRREMIRRRDRAYAQAKAKKIKNGLLVVAAIILLFIILR